MSPYDSLAAAFTIGGSATLKYMTINYLNNELNVIYVSGLSYYNQKVNVIFHLFI